MTTKDKETPAEKRKRLEKRNRYRTTVCAGCHYNYYNFAKPADSVGVEVPDDYSCWYVVEIKRGKCHIYHR